MRHALIWGSILGLAIAVFQLLLAVTGPEHHDLVYNADLLFLIVGLVFAHRALRRAGDGSLGYRRAVGLGAVVTVVAGLLSRLGLYLQLEYYDDALFDLIRAQWRQAYAQRGMGAEEIEQTVRALRFSPWSFAQGNFLSFVVTGLVLTLIVSAFTRKRSGG